MQTGKIRKIYVEEDEDVEPLNPDYLEDIVLGKKENIDIEYLENVIHQYPYFQTPRILLSKTLKQERDISFHEVLKTTAVYCPNRTVLFDHVNPKVKGEKVNSGFSERKKSYNTNRRKKTEEVSDIDIRNENKSFETEREYVNENNHNNNREFIWELSKKQKKQKKEKSRESKKNKENESQIEKIYSNAETNENNNPIQRQFDIINKFITSNYKKPSATYADIPDRNKPVEIIENNYVAPSNESQENSSIMTETLAAVYTDQGYFDKAIRTYKILMLKHPEKSGYFADKIKYIENNNKK